MTRSLRVFPPELHLASKAGNPLIVSRATRLQTQPTLILATCCAIGPLTLAMADESSNLSSPPAETEVTTATSVVKAETSTTQLRGKKRQSEPVAPEAKRTKRASRAAKLSYAEDSEEEQKEEVIQTTPKKSKKAVKTEAEEEVKEEKQNGENRTTTKKAPRKRKTKEEKDAEMAPLAARTAASKLFVGAHVSAAGGVQNAVTNSVHIG